MEPLSARIAANWTSAAGALEGVLSYLGAPLPRHGVMGLSGHAWHVCLSVRGGVVALPSGAVELDWAHMVENGYRRCGYRWERFSGDLRSAGGADVRERAIEWAAAHLDAGRPLIGWDLLLHEYSVITAYDRERRGFVVDNVLSEQPGAFAPWDEWPTSLGKIEVYAPVAAAEMDGIVAIVEALRDALERLDGRLEVPGSDSIWGTPALEAWAAALEGADEVDRAGNAYNLAVLQAARIDGSMFLDDLAAALEPLAQDFTAAAESFRAEAKVLSPLLTLFPFPAGGHGNIASQGLRSAAAQALRRAAAHERVGRGHVAAALEALGSD